MGPQPQLTSRPCAPAPPRAQWQPSFPAQAALGSGSGCLMAFGAALLILHLGRPFETFLSGLHLPGIICWAAIPACVLFGAFRGLKTRVGIALALSIGWLFACVPTSTWRGGSLSYVLEQGAFRGVMLLILAAAPRSFNDLKKLVWVLALACTLKLFLGFKLVAGDRLASQGTWGNPDDVALMAGLALPLLVYVCLRFSKRLIGIPLALSGGGFLLYAMALSGTRAGLVAFAAMIAICLLRSPTRIRVAICICLVPAILGTWLLLPPNVRQRLGTTLDAFDSETVAVLQPQSEAMHSVAERRDLIKDAIRMTLQNPVFGVGPGRYGEYRWSNLATQDGGRKRWFPSHNTYLQISSESGIPGLVLYLTFLGVIYRTIIICRRLNEPGTHADADASRYVATALELSLIYFATGAIFMTCDAHPHVYAIAGLAVALERVTRLRLAETSAMPLPAPRSELSSRSYRPA